MLDADSHAVLQTLLRARHQHAGAELTGLVAPADGEQIAAIQDALSAELGWAPRSTATVWKAGAISDGSPVCIPLPETAVRTQNGSYRRGLLPRVGVETEICFRLGRDVSAAEAAAMDDAAVLAAFDALCVSIELVDSRWRIGMDAPEAFKLADHQSHGGLVIGDWVANSAHDWQAIALRVTAGEHGIVAQRGGHPCSRPTWVLPYWLRHVATQAGVARKGCMVTTGSWCGMQWVEPDASGVTVAVSFEGVGSTRVRLYR
ncbi:fumarylacetoacetate hydrolase family protein [Uliginosibacterium sp. H1]|uniref:fumarylacetoacetate hydrolase family protein n=1 Tax=Uliginosibacterium sp. H1 TaxID=3114757 RepID=UPI002E19A161|nr:hypothetical protein [Uliginosibacterium sp. H1]